MKKYLIWFKQAWPIIYLIPIIIFHYLLLNLPCFNHEILCYDNPSINKLISLILQIIGGLIVIYSIDSNLELFKKKNLFNISIAWFKRCPIRKSKTIEFKLATSKSKNLTSTVNVELAKKPETVEDKINDLYEKLKSLEEKTQKHNINFTKQIAKINDVNNKKQLSTSKSLRSIENKLENISIGGLKLQIFGVFLLIYGAILGYLS